MDTTWKVTAADRDEQGRIKVEEPVEEPRSLADLLPKPEEIKADAAKPAPNKLTKHELAGLAAAALAAAFIIVYAWTTPAEQVRPAAAMPTAYVAVPTVAAVVPSPAPTALPLPTAAPVSAYWAPGGEHAPDLHGAHQPIARYGETWVQIQDGRWIAAGDAGLDSGALLGLPDLSPPPPPPPAPRVIVVEAPPAAAPTQPPAAAPAVDMSHVSKVDTRVHQTAVPEHGSKTLDQQPGDESLSPALMREAQDK